jgi:hypothetical protein
MDVTFMDPETAKVAVELQLADINDLLDGLYDNEDLPKGDARESFKVLDTTCSNSSRNWRVECSRSRFLNRNTRIALLFQGC